VSGSPWTIDV